MKAKAQYKPKRGMWTVDECLDANGHCTIRVADGTPNGNTDLQPIATVYSALVAERIVRDHNFSLKNAREG